MWIRSRTGTVITHQVVHAKMGQSNKKSLVKNGFSETKEESTIDAKQTVFIAQKTQLRK